jgi:hypothetical protein
MKYLRVLLYGLLFLLGSGIAQAQNTPTRDAMTHFFDANTGDLRGELADAKAAGKKGMLLMYEQALYRKHFVNFTIDLFGSVPLQDFKGREITEKAFAAEARVRATPTFAFHDLTGAEVVRITGAVRDVAEFKLLAEFVASGAYRSRSFAEHRQLHLKKGG